MFKELFTVNESKDPLDDEFYAWHENDEMHEKYETYFKALYKYLKKYLKSRPGETLEDMRDTMTDGEITSIMNDIRQMEAGKTVKFPLGSLR